MWDLLPNSIKLPLRCRISDAKVSHFHSCSPFEELVTCPLLPSFLIFCHRPLLLDSQMSQELGITEKSPDFTNPYRTERDDVSKMQACWSTLSFIDFKHSHFAPQLSLIQHYRSYPIWICLAHPFSPTSGASHSRGFPEDPEGGGEEEEERRKEERNQERPPYLTLSHRAIAPHWTTARRAEAKGIGAYAAVAKVWWWWWGDWLDV